MALAAMVAPCAALADEPARQGPAAASAITEPIGDDARQKRRRELLDVLFQQLAKAENKETADLIERGVWRLWLDSGSATVDLAMARVAEALQREDLSLALDLLNGVVKLRPDYAEGWNKRATVLFMLKDFTHAMQDIERALALEPRHFGALSGLGMILVEIGSREAALRAFRRALGVHPHLDGVRRQEAILAREVEGRGI